MFFSTTEFSQGLVLVAEDDEFNLLGKDIKIIKLFLEDKNHNKSQ